MELMSGCLRKDFDILVRSMESFQKKHPLNKVTIGVLMNDFRGSYRPVWTGDVEALAPFTPTPIDEPSDGEMVLPEVCFYISIAFHNECIAEWKSTFNTQLCSLL